MCIHPMTELPNTENRRNWRTQQAEIIPGDSKLPVSVTRKKERNHRNTPREANVAGVRNCYEESMGEKGHVWKILNPNENGESGHHF